MAKMLIDRSTVEQALEALDGVEALLTSMDVTHLLVYEEVNNAITALRAALAEPVQEPVQQALCEADRIMSHDDEATEWRERWAHLFSCALTNGGYQCSCGANQRNAK